MTGRVDALTRLDETTRLLRRECPWDREQDERSIVPHTVEEAYELAAAALTGDDRKLVDELGDVLFQVFFLSLLLEERGAGDLAAVADGCREKLVRRHPHVFGDVEVADSSDVRRNWDEIKRGEPGREPGVFGDIPETLPSTLYAAKVLRRAEGRQSAPSIPEALAALERARDDRECSDAVGTLERARDDHERSDAVGTLMLAAVAQARALGVDPELSLRSAADRFKRATEGDE